MARFHTFSSYDEYVKAQKHLTMRKVGAGRTRCFVARDEVHSISEYHKKIGKVENGMCHGVRLGKELDMFEEEFGEGKWVGTEIVAELCDGVRIFNADFSHIRDEWVGTFDVIFSNSLDHSHTPFKTVKAWVACLSPTGRLYVEWTPWHNKLGGFGACADCYAANEEEYFELFRSVGKIEAVLVVNAEGENFYRKIYVVY